MTKKHEPRSRWASHKNPAEIHQSRKLEDSEAFYYSLVENIPQFIICKDLEGRFTFVNQRFCRLLGKSFDEIIGKTDLDFYPEELARKYRNDDRRVIEQNETLEFIEENRVSHHETIYVHVVKTPIHDAQGTVIGMQGIFWDITKRKKAEEELHNAHERMKNDLIAAAKVQQGFIPESPPTIPGYQFSWLFAPSEYVGGDLLNIIRLDEKRWAFYVMDMSGHGVPAALLSVLLTRMIDQTPLIQSPGSGDAMTSSVSKELFDPKKLVHLLNRRFPGDPSKFCTLLYAILDTEQSTITWARAGHEPPLLIQQKGKQAHYFQHPSSPCISNLFVGSNGVETDVITLKPGDRFIIYSDGLTEAMRDKEEFGYDRLKDTILEKAHLPLDQSLQEIIQSASAWKGDDNFEDDITLLVLEKST